MKNKISKLISTGVVGLSLTLAAAAFAEEVVVDSLKAGTVGQFPEGWKTYPFYKGKVVRVYKIAEEAGRRYLRAEDSEDLSAPAFRNFDWDLEKYPYLKFRWRAQKIPAGSREDNPKTNDSACGVYVGFSRTSAMKYVWSESLSVGSFWAKNPKKFFVIVKESGSANLGQWREAVIPVKEDYEKYFKKPAQKSPMGIGVLTDGNAVHQPAACDYADFRISSTP